MKHPPPRRIPRTATTGREAGSTTGAPGLGDVYLHLFAVWRPLGPGTHS